LRVKAFGNGSYILADDDNEQNKYWATWCGKNEFDKRMDGEEYIKDGHSTEDDLWSKLDPLLEPARNDWEKLVTAENAYRKKLSNLWLFKS
jgi:hypothetical protein